MSSLMKTVERQEIAFRDEMLAAIDVASGASDDRRRMINILVQRRILSIDMFTWMVDHLICAIDDDEAREIAIGILRDEYCGPNHRYEFLMEIVQLGVTKRWVLRQRMSATTREVEKRIRKVTKYLIDATELERLAFLRFFSEVLPGQEFAHLLAILQNRKMIDPAASRFLRPHVNYDVVGIEDSLSHADQYRLHVARLLEQRSDLDLVERMLREARDIRILFYSQFAR